MSTQTRTDRKRQDRETLQNEKLSEPSQEKLTGQSSADPNALETQNKVNYATRAHANAKAQQLPGFQNQEMTRFSRNPGWFPSNRWNKNSVKTHSKTASRQRHLQSEVSNISPAIGLGKATGILRKPDITLTNSPQLIQHRLKDLLTQSKHLESNELTAFHIDERGDNSSQSSVTALKKWEVILGDFRQLTMAVTASSLQEVRHMAISVYEGAADASLLAGNLSFYLSCQSRLLSDLYDDYFLGSNSTAADRREECISYSLLYFGIFCEDALELAVTMRRMRVRTLASPLIKFSLSVVTAFKNEESTKFISLFNQCSLRQKTILKPCLQSVRKAALAEMIRSYLVLERNCAVSRLGMNSENEFLKLLASERPDLTSRNSETSAEFRFRLANAS